MEHVPSASLHSLPLILTQLYCASLQKSTPHLPPQNAQRKHDFTQKLLTSNICKTFVLICQASWPNMAIPTKM